MVPKLSPGKLDCTNVPSKALSHIEVWVILLAYSETKTRIFVYWLKIKWVPQNCVPNNTSSINSDRLLPLKRELTAKYPILRFAFEFFESIIPFFIIMFYFNF